MNSGIEKSFCSSYHLDIIYRKINFRFPLSLPCFRTIWNYKNASAGFLQSDIENFNCQYAFESKTNNEKVQITQFTFPLSPQNKALKITKYCIFPDVTSTDF